MLFPVDLLSPKLYALISPVLLCVVCHVASSSGDSDLRVTAGPKGGCKEGASWFRVEGAGASGFWVWGLGFGALGVRRVSGFGV